MSRWTRCFALRRLWSRDQTQPYYWSGKTRQLDFLASHWLQILVLSIICQTCIHCKMHVLTISLCCLWAKPGQLKKEINTYPYLSPVTYNRAVPSVTSHVFSLGPHHLSSKNVTDLFGTRRLDVVEDAMPRQLYSHQSFLVIESLSH